MDLVFAVVLFLVPNVIFAQECFRKGISYDDGATWMESCKRFACAFGIVSEELTGCPYEGECIPLDTNKENFTTCKIAKCVSSGSGYRLTNSANGCIDDSKICHPIGSEWTVDKCFVKTCELVSEGVVQEKLVSSGCPYDGDVCLSVGERRKPSLCIEYECQQNGLSFGVKLISGGCEDKNTDTCRDEGTKWTDNCIQYECSKVNLGYKAEPIKKDCMFMSECKKDGTTWMDGCMEYECTNGLFKLLEGKCQGKDGCYAVGAEWKEGSISYTCTKNGNSYAKVVAKDENGVIKGGCNVNGKTRNVGEEWDEGCFRKTCKRYDTVVRTEVVSGQCLHNNGSCIPVGTVFEEDCYTYECKKESDMKYKLDTVYIKCRSTEDGKDVCLRNGESSYVSQCSTRVCTVDMKTKSWKLDVKAECVFKIGNMKECIPKNEFGVNDRCIKYKCEITQKGKQTRAQMRRVGATGCYIKKPEQLKRFGDIGSAVNGYCAQVGDKFTDSKCRILKCQGNRIKKKLQKIRGKAEGC